MITKKIKGIILLASICIMLMVFTSCVKTKFGPVEDTSENAYILPDNAKVLTIAELKGFKPGDMDYIGQYTDVADGGKTKDLYINVVVIGNDVTGNLYKNMFVRDVVDASAALNISVDKTGLYNFYPVGQKIYIKVTGLYIGRYNGLPQLGYPFTQDNGIVQLGRIPDALFNLHIFKNGSVSAGIDLAKPIPITSPTGLHDGLLNQLLVLENVEFSLTEVGLELAPKPPLGQIPISTNRGFSFTNGGGAYFLRTSSAARFSSVKVPGGSADLTCIYTVYGRDAQFYVRSLADFDTAFDFAPATTNEILKETFSASLGTFKTVSVIGEQEWGHDASYKCAIMKANVEQTYFANKDWLISPKLELSSDYEEIFLTVEQALNYKGSQGWENFALMISSDYDPTNNAVPATATWEVLEVPNKPTGINFTFVPSGKIDLSSYKGKNVHIAFVYKSTTAAAATWEIKNVLVLGVK